MRAAESREMEEELQHLRSENAELQKRVDAVASVEAAKKKADVKVEQLEEKVRIYILLNMHAT